jgi:GT2 family glycosyltransferase
VINENPDVDLIYTDEDKLQDDKYHVEPFFKPDWSPDFLNSCNYITHFATIKKDIMLDVGGFTLGTQGAQDWDLFLKITKKTDKIYHIPKILYTWRKSATSTAMSADTKPYAYINQKKVLRKSVADRGLNASVDAHPALGFWRVKYVVEGNPLVSIIIPTKDNYKLIKQCVDSIIEHTTYPYFEIVIVDTGSTDEKVKSYYKSLLDSEQSVRILNWKKKFNFSAVCNYGAENANGEYFVFLNNDTEVITHDWIQGLLEHAQRPQNGMVGAKLLFPNETVQHAGVVLSERDIAFHPFYGQNPFIDIFNYIYIANIRNVSAVTAACSMVSREKFLEVGGFDTELRVTYNDVDLCLKLRQQGYNNVYMPFVELFHYESMSVGRIDTDDRDKKEFEAAKALMLKRWKSYLQRDPYYSDVFEQHGPGYKLPR